MGYEREKIGVGGKRDIKVRVSEESELLEEVVVVGYGVEGKSELRGGVGWVKRGDGLKSRGRGNVWDGLEGGMAGVWVV